MRTRRFLTAAFMALALCLVAAAQSQQLSPEQKAKVDGWLAKFQALGNDPKVVAAVRDYNAKPPAVFSGMNQEKWAALAAISEEVKALAKNDLAEYLKTKREPVVTELFVSAANGNKVAFFGKTSSWSHAGKPKHDVPMSGKTWVGAIEFDESSNRTSVQVSFPVLDGGKAIGSIIIGLDVSKL